MTPLPSNPTVRIWREASTGDIIRIDSNVAVDLKVEVVPIQDGECIMTVDKRIEGSYPFSHATVDPVPRS